MLTLKEYLKTTPKYIDLLAENGIRTIRDFFLYFPRAYEDRKNLVMLADIQSEEVQYTVKMFIVSMTILKTGKGRKIITYQAHDEHGDKATVNFFYAPYLVGHIRQEQRYLVIGKPKNAKKKIQFWHPEMVLTEAPSEEAEKKDSSAPFHSPVNDVNPDAKRILEKKEEALYQTNRIYPVYPELQGIKSGWFAKKIRENKHHIPELFPEYLPKSVLQEADLLDYTTTMQAMHYPETVEQQQDALRRVSFDKLLGVQLSSIMQKHAYQTGHVFQAQQLDRDCIKEIVDALPFVLTQAQKKMYQGYCRKPSGNKTYATFTAMRCG